MGLSAPRSIFGVHSVSPYSRVTGLPYGILKVLKSSSLSMSGETIPLMGGSNKYPWAIEDGAITCEMSLNFSQYEDFVFELFLGKAPTAGTTEATGNVSTLTNKYGTTAKSATIGVASVAATAADETDLKFGKYVIKVVSATTIDIYLLSDIDIARGNNAEYQNDALKLNATPLTITSGATTAVAELGLTFTGGSGTIGMTIGDTATFDVRPINTKSSTVRIGSSNDSVFPEFGCIAISQKRSTGEMFEIDLFRCKAIGMPINFEKDTWSEAEVKVSAFYDSSKDGIFDLRHVTI